MLKMKVLEEISIVIEVVKMKLEVLILRDKRREL
jgi:hypothetical protein